MKIVGSSEWKGEVCVTAKCETCAELLFESAESLSDRNEEVDCLTMANTELNKILENNDKEIAELRDFIDGYIDEK